MNPVDVNTAVNILKSSGIIAYPTEAVWGLGCDPFNLSAVNRIKKLKKRGQDKGLILVASHVKQLGSLYSSLTLDQKNLIQKHSSIPTTWLIKDSANKIPLCIKGPFSSVAVRISCHPDVVALCDQFEGMIVSTSANISNENPALSLYEAQEYFGTKIDGYLEGAIGGASKPSQIIDLNDGSLIRP